MGVADDFRIAAASLGPLHQESLGIVAFSCSSWAVQSAICSNVRGRATRDEWSYACVEQVGFEGASMLCMMVWSGRKPQKGQWPILKSECYDLHASKAANTYVGYHYDGWKTTIHTNSKQHMHKNVHTCTRACTHTHTNMTSASSAARAPHPTPKPHPHPPPTFWYACVILRVITTRNARLTRCASSVLLAACASASMARLPPLLVMLPTIRVPTWAMRATRVAARPAKLILGGG